MHSERRPGPAEDSRPIRDYCHPRNLIPPTLTPEKLGRTPLTLDRTPGGRGAPRAVFFKVKFSKLDPT